MKCVQAIFVLLFALALLVNTCNGASSCDPNPCKNFGACVVSGNGGTEHFCICIPYFTGTNCESGGFPCFTTNSTVVNESGSRIHIQDVSVGDRVLSFDKSGKLFYSEVAMWMDHVPEVKLDIIQFTTQSGKTFKATPYHLVLIGKSFTQMRHVKVGDELLMTDDGKQMHTEKVESILKITDGVGAFAPLTHEGTIVVDGVAASCYAYSHQLGQIVFAPMKVMSRLGIVSGKADGMHWYSKMLVDWTGAVGATEWLLA